MFNLFQTEKNRMKLNYCILLKYDRKTDKKRNPPSFQLKKERRVCYAQTRILINRSYGFGSSSA